MMNRQIKFRAWDVNQKIWVTNSTTITAEHRILTMMVDDKNAFHCFTRKRDEVKIQQAIGKKDKAAREIYEGDIVKLKTHLDFGDQFGQYIFLEVYYHDESASFRLSRDKQMGYYRSFTDLESGHIEVVGNIFETPDLLKRDPVDLHVYSVYLDSDGSIYCYDANGELVEYPSSWPEKIENVREFARREGVKFIEG